MERNNKSVPVMEYKDESTATDQPDTESSTEPATYTGNTSFNHLHLRSLTSLFTEPVIQESPMAKVHVSFDVDRYDIYGVDVIWHNMYRGPKSDFHTMRAHYDCSVDALIRKVAGHIAQGLYFIISLNASKHSLTVIFGCEIMKKDFPAGVWDDPAWEGVVFQCPTRQEGEVNLVE
jgi:hypothetical protein